MLLQDFFQYNILRVTRNKWQLLRLQFVNATENDINFIFLTYYLDQTQYW